MGRYDEYLECRGDCGGRFHIGCVGVTVESFVDMKKSGETKSWRCPECLRTSPEDHSLSVENTGSLAAGGGALLSGGFLAAGSSTCGRCSELVDFFERAVKSLEKRMLDEMSIFKDKVVGEIKAALDKNSAKIEDVKVQLSASISEYASHQVKSSCQGSCTVGGYAQAAARNCSVVIKPRNDKQSNATTKTDLLHCVDPVASNVNLSGVRHIRGGGVLVSCPSKESVEKLTKRVSDKLSDKYTVQEARSLHPRIRVVGLSENHSEDTFLKYLKVQNAKIFIEASEVKLVSFGAVRGRGKLGDASDGGGRMSVYQAVIQLDSVTYGRAISAGRLFVGYDCCVVYDALDLVRCYNCSGFGHVSGNCKAKPACPRCSENHLVNDCTAQSLKCINCFSASKIIPDISCNHAAWDRECAVYKRKLKLLRDEVLGLK